ncbi:Enoyl-[acyl-carrier-protein] reductase [FMN] [hydrothermal vent metagenome]|uniref:Enoyl-[acyl-carrier-protein] reductase [FMN] n=1 Tax=hydrothermal vent metagenome TaxID=652676 RepID=A0A3B0YFF4_9ZZZZ
MQTEFTRALGIEVPLICGAMYPCSNPELVAAVSEAGGIGIVQPLSLTYVHGYDFREGLRYIRSLTDKPVGVNLIIEASSERYLKRVHEWLDIALEEEISFFVTALGNPRRVVERAAASGAIVYHDVTERRWAEKALDGGVDGFICVNNRAGGHAGTLSPDQLLDDIGPLGKPLICAGGIGSADRFSAALRSGYTGAQLGTRFIASEECSAHDDYKRAILTAHENDIVLTDKISGVPVSVIRTPYIERTGTHAGPLAKRLLRNPKTKHWMRLIYTLQSLWTLKRASLQGVNYKDFFQAGKSVEGISKIQSVKDIFATLAQADD